ncbi:MAG: HD domain-containing protein [Campylobacterota bacterium]|nr:HD domain-containing protein [Campylobacterota bacterium]
MNQTNNSIFSKVFWVTLLIKQNEYHSYGVLLHTLKVTWGAIKDRKYRFIIPALLHDIGKPIVAYQKPKDIPAKTYSFTDHEEKSYLMIKNWFFLSDWSKDMVRYHYLIRDISKCKEENKLERLKRLETSWDKLTPKFKNDLKQFLVYDEYGK